MQSSPRIILLFEATRGFDRGLLSGVARYSALNGPWTFYRQPHGYLRSNHRLDLKELEAWKPDGAICAVPQVAELSRLRVPLIAYDVNEYVGHVPCVFSEGFEAGRLAAQHLLDLGHRHFAFCGYSGIRWSRERCQTFRDLFAGHANVARRSAIWLNRPGARSRSTDREVDAPWPGQKRSLM